MSRIVTISIVFLSSCLYAASSRVESAEVEKARQYGADGQVTLLVTDSTGKPVEKADVKVAFFHSDSRGGTVVSKGQTDTNGFFIATGKTIHSMTYEVKKDDYYTREGKYWFHRYGKKCVRASRWQPWNPTNTVILKEHREPSPMCAQKLDVSIPIRNQFIGFDFEKADWMAPYGQGATADILLKYVLNYEGPQEFSKRLEITFENPRDGVKSFDLDKTSVFMSDYTAPENGYASEMADEYARTRTKILKSQEIGKGKYLVFRTRTVTNEVGRIISANYSKIYGPNLQNPIEYGHMGGDDRLMFTYYFNPTANDRNLEFDPSKNLLNVKRRVYQP